MKRKKIAGIQDPILRASVEIETRYQRARHDLDCPECGKSLVPAGDGGDAYNCVCPDPLIAEAVHAARS